MIDFLLQLNISIHKMSLASSGTAMMSTGNSIKKIIWKQTFLFSGNFFLIEESQNIYKAKPRMSQNFSSGK